MSKTRKKKIRFREKKFRFRDFFPEKCIPTYNSGPLRPILTKLSMRNGHSLGMMSDQKKISISRKKIFKKFSQFFFRFIDFFSKNSAANKKMFPGFFLFRGIFDFAVEGVGERSGSERSEQRGGCRRAKRAARRRPRRLHQQRV